MNNEPAFAASGHPGNQFIQQEGMKLRDYFAAKAMQGIVVNTERNEFSFGKVDEIAQKAYELADAMLKARE